MNITYDSNKLSQIIKDLILKANNVETGVNLQNISSGDFKEIAKPEDPLFLNDSSFYDYYEAFQTSLNNAIDENILKSGKGIKYNDIVNKYNRLVKYITLNMKYYQLSTFKKNIIDKELSKLSEDIDAVKSITPQQGATEMYNLTLEKMIKNLEKKDYEPIKVELKKTLDNAKLGLNKLGSELQQLIAIYNVNPSSVTKRKIADKYQKYLDIYKRIATLYTKSQRQQFIINDETFMNDINSILDVDVKQILSDIVDAKTTGDNRTVANQGLTEATARAEVIEQKPEIDILKKETNEEFKSRMEQKYLGLGLDVGERQKALWLNSILRYLETGSLGELIPLTDRKREFLFPLLGLIPKKK
jgi:hypothetical protein